MGCIIVQPVNPCTNYCAYKNYSRVSPKLLTIATMLQLSPSTLSRRIHQFGLCVQRNSNLELEAIAR